METKRLIRQHSAAAVEEKKELKEIEDGGNAGENTEGPDGKGDGKLNFVEMISKKKFKIFDLIWIRFQLIESKIRFNNLKTLLPLLPGTRLDTLIFISCVSIVTRYQAGYPNLHILCVHCYQVPGWIP